MSCDQPQENTHAADRLETAFSLFNQASVELIDSYAKLQKDVASLSAQLELANLALVRQTSERVGLAERLALLLDALPAGVVECASDGRILSLNPAASEMLGNGWPGRLWDELMTTLSPADVAHGWWLTDPLGVVRQIQVETRELPMGGRIVLLHDNTRTQLLLRQLAAQERLAAMGQMMAGLAHQLRTPLSAAMLYAANLSEPGLPASARQRFAERTLERLRQLEGQIQDTLSYVRGDIMPPGRVPLSRLLDSVHHAVAGLAAARQVGFDIELQAAPDLIMADEQTLASALICLVENAMAFSPAGSVVTLAVDLTEAGLSLCVIDCGAGVPPEMAERIFEPFVTTRTDGTGLGLALARQIVTQHGGTLHLDAGYADGAKFVITLPLIPQTTNGS